MSGREPREGAKPREKSTPFHARVLAGLADLSDAELAALAKGFPELVPDDDGDGFSPARKLFTAKTVRALLGEPREELRGVALWVLGEHAPSVAVPLAFEALASRRASGPIRAAALRVLRHVSADRFGDAFDHVARTFVAPASVEEMFAAHGAVIAIEHPDLVKRIAELLAELAKTQRAKPWSVSPAQMLLKAIERRKLQKALAVPLARYAVATNLYVGPTRREAAKMVRASKDREALAILATWKE